MVDLTGCTFQEFEVRKAIKSDLTFAIYQAHHRVTEKDAVLWLVFPEENPSALFTNGLLQRLDILSLIEHPNLMPVLAFGEHEGTVYWITPEMPGKLLSDLCQEPCPESEAARLAAQIADGLAYLHSQDLLHETLSPETVLVTPDNQVVVFHYALASILNCEIKQNVPEGMLGYGIGSPAYLAPEQILGREPTSQSDLYALGAIYFSLLTGCTPFPASTPAEVALRKFQQPLSWPKKLPGKISQTSIRLIHKCLSVQPQDRFQKATEVKNLLDRLRQGKGTRVAVRRAQLAGAPRPSRAGLWLALAAAALVVLGWFGYQWFSPSFAPQQAISAASTPSITSDTQQLTPTAAAPKGATHTAAPTKAGALDGPIQPAEDPALPKSTPTPTQSIAPWAMAPVLNNTPSPGKAEQITAANISQVREAARLGYGKFFQAAISPDGKTVAVASTAGVILFQNQEIHAFFDLQQEATSVQFSPEGDLLAIGLMKGEVQLWDWKARQVSVTFAGHTGRVSRILFSPNRRNLITASFDQMIKIWDINTGQVTQNLPAHPLPIRDLSLSKDGRVLASTSDDRTIKVWNMADGKKLREYYHSAPVHAVTVSEDGTYVAAGAENGEIRQWNITTDQVRADPYFFDRGIWSIYYTASANEIIVGLDGGEVGRAPGPYHKSRWTLSTIRFIPPPVELLNTLGGGFEFTYHTALGPEGMTATVTWDGNLKTSTGFNFANPTTYDDIVHLVFSPNSQMLAAGGVMENISMWKMKSNQHSGKTKGFIPPGDPYTSDSKFITLVNERTIAPKKAGDKPTTADVIALYSTPILQNAQSLSAYPANASVQFVLDNNLLIAGTLSRSKFWDMQSGYETYLREGNNLGCQITHSANDGDIFTVYSPVGMMTEWDDAARLICSRSGGFGSRFAGFSPGRKWLVYLNENGLLEMRNTENKTVAWLTPLNKPISAHAFSPDDALLVTGSPDGSLTVWNMEDGQILHEFPAHYGAVHSLAFSPNGLRFASGSADGMVRIWEVFEDAQP